MTLKEKIQKTAVAMYLRREEAYALLEYCAGAAIICGLLWTALHGMGVSMSALINDVGAWATARRADF